MDRITKEAKDNLELQVLILSTIDTYNHEKRLATEAGVSVTENMALKKKKTSEDSLTIGENEKIRRGQVHYTNWVKKLFHQALNYMDPAVFPNDFVKHIDLETCKQIFEGGTHLRLYGEQVDRVADDGKLATFNALRTLYEDNGSLWKTYVWAGYSVSFDGPNGCFSKRVAYDGRIMITCKGIEGEVEFPKSVFGSDPGPFVKIEANFSLKSAHFKTPIDKYNLAFLFPVLGRSLKRRRSEEVGAAAGAPAPRANAIREATAARRDGVLNDGHEDEEEASGEAIDLGELAVVAAKAPPAVLPDPA